jgi:hypothetical protein
VPREPGVCVQKMSTLPLAEIASAAVAAAFLPATRISFAACDHNHLQSEPLANAFENESTAWLHTTNYSRQLQSLRHQLQQCIHGCSFVTSFVSFW